MRIAKWALSAFFFTFLIFPTLSFAQDTLHDECPVPDPPFYADKPFFFDSFTFYIANKRTTKKMETLEAKEGRVRNTFFGLPGLFTGMGELFGACGDWWPENLALPFSYGYQALLGKLDYDKDFGARIAAHNYKLQIAGRVHIRPETFGLDVDTVIFFALEDTHWSYHAGETVFVDGEEYEVEEYVAFNDIDVSRFATTIDIFSLQFAHQFTLLDDDDLRMEYRIGKNLFQAAFTDALKRRRWHSYPYPWFVEGRLSYGVTENTELSFTAQSEFSSDEQPYMAEVAWTAYNRWLPNEGFGFFHQWFGGIDDNEFISLRFGIWTSSSMTGFRWVTKH